MSEPKEREPITPELVEWYIKNAINVDTGKLALEVRDLRAQLATYHEIIDRFKGTQCCDQMTDSRIGELLAARAAISKLEAKEIKNENSTVVDASAESPR